MGIGSLIFRFERLSVLPPVDLGRKSSNFDRQVGGAVKWCFKSGAAGGGLVLRVAKRVCERERSCRSAQGCGEGRERLLSVMGGEGARLAVNMALRVSLLSLGLSRRDVDLEREGKRGGVG